MANLDNTLQEIVNMDYDMLLGMAKKAVTNLKPAVCKADPNQKGGYMTACVVLTAMMADGKVSPPERQLLKDLLQLNDQKAGAFIQLYRNEMAVWTQRFLNQVSSDEKADTMILITCIAAVDETISKEETALIRKLVKES